MWHITIFVTFTSSTRIFNIFFFFFFVLVLASIFGASSGARVSDAVLACSASKDIWNNSLTWNDAIGQRPVLRYSRQLGPQPRIIEQSSPLNGVGKFVKEKFSPPVGIEPVHFCIEVERSTNWATPPIRFVLFIC